MKNDRFTWATDDNYPAGSDPWSGTPTKVPLAGLATGATPQKGLGAQHVNWAMNKAGSASQQAARVMPAFQRHALVSAFDRPTSIAHLRGWAVLGEFGLGTTETMQVQIFDGGRHWDTVVGPDMDTIDSVSPTLASNRHRLGMLRQQTTNMVFRYSTNYGYTWNDSVQPWPGTSTNKTFATMVAPGIDRWFAMSQTEFGYADTYAGTWSLCVMPDGFPVTKHNEIFRELIELSATDFVLAIGGSIFWSSDAGVTWNKPVAPFLQEGNRQAQALYQRDGALYLGVWTDGLGDEVWRSVDNGHTWVQSLQLTHRTQIIGACNEALYMIGYGEPGGGMRGVFRQVDQNGLFLFVGAPPAGSIGSGGWVVAQGCGPYDTIWDQRNASSGGLMIAVSPDQVFTDYKEP